MNYIYKNNTVTLENRDSFDITQTLECGQCFRFTRLADNEYIVIAHSKALRVTQHDGVTDFYPCTEGEFENIWIPYFDLRRDYGAIKQALAADPVVSRAIEYADGIRILNQDPWECLLSFIISQNMNIPRIKKLIGTISERYGTPGDGFFAFPSAEQLQNAGQSGFADCKTGFRAKYLCDAVEKSVRGELTLSELSTRPTAELRAALTGIYGVGDKVADCVMLFSFGRHEVFPMDVWIKRAMQNLYFGGREARPREVHEFARDKFGRYAGFAQQYLFHYVRGMSRC